MKLIRLALILISLPLAAQAEDRKAEIRLDEITVTEYP
jgi:hypothetical protein